MNSRPTAIKSIAICVLGLLSMELSAQISVPGQPLDIIDKMQDTTTFSLYRSIRYQNLESFKLLNPLVKFSYNLEYPRGYNDGAVWKGKGMTGEIHGGFTGSLGKITYTFYPVMFYSQNAAYDQAPDIGRSINEFGYQFGTDIDWVQKYGSGSFVSIHPGQSEISIDFGKFNTAISTQNYSLGPSVFNPILLSRQAAGFPHIRFGIEPMDLVIRRKNIGKVEANLLMGLLKESDYFDNNSKNDSRYFNSISLAYSPSFLPEVTVGFNKVLYKQTRFFETWDILSTAYIFDSGTRGDTIDTNDTFDQLASLTIEWKLSEAGFRTYLEFAKNDFTTSNKFRFFAIEPEHSRAYTIGIEKRISTSKDKQIIINYEHTNLSRNHTFLWRPEPTFYTHGVNRQGYTHNGQILGGGIGPGANSDHLAIRIEKQNRKLGLLLQRIEHNKDYFVVNVQDFTNHDIEYSAELQFLKETDSMIFFGLGSLNYNYNRYYRGDKINFSLAFGASFKIN